MPKDGDRPRAPCAAPADPYGRRRVNRLVNLLARPCSNVRPPWPTPVPTQSETRSGLRRFRNNPHTPFIIGFWQPFVKGARIHFQRAWIRFQRDPSLCADLQHKRGVPIMAIRPLNLLGLKSPITQGRCKTLQCQGHHRAYHHNYTPFQWPSRVNRAPEIYPPTCATYAISHCTMVPTAQAGGFWSPACRKPLGSDFGLIFCSTGTCLRSSHPPVPGFPRKCKGTSPCWAAGGTVVPPRPDWPADTVVFRYRGFSCTWGYTPP